MLGTSEEERQSSRVFGAGVEDMRRRDGASIKAEDYRSPRGSSLYVPRVSEAPLAEEEPSMKSVTKMNDARRDDGSNGPS